MAGFRSDMDKTGEAMQRMAKGALVAAAGIAGSFYVAKRGFDYVTKAAMKQEDALFLLEAALKAAGEYTDEAMRGFEAFAASIQKATVYGDEEVLALMQLMKSLGVTSSGLEQATRMAIGLAAATGRDVRSMGMYIALAQQGEFTMLRRFIPALRKTTDATEQLRIMTEFCAGGFKIAEAQAETTSGSLKQMWMAVGDLAEAMGKPFLDTMAEDADNLKTAIEGSTKAVEEWEETITSDFVKPLNQKIYPALKVVITTAGYLVSGIHTVRAAFTQLSGGAFVAAGGIIIAFGEIESALEKLNKVAAKSWLGKKLDLPVIDKAAGISALGKALIEEGKALDKAAGEMMLDLPSLKIAEGFKKFDKIIEESRAPKKLSIEEQYEEVLRKKIAMFDEELAANQKKIDTLKQTEGFYLEATTEAHRKAAGEIDKVWTEMWLKEEEKAYHAMRAPIIEAERLAEESAERRKRIAEDIALSMASSWSNAIDQMMFESKKFWDAMEEMARSLLREITRIIMYKTFAEPMAYNIMGLEAPGGGPNLGRLLLSGITGLFGGGPTAAAAEAPYVAAYGAPWTTVQHGGEVTKTGLAVIHKGEKYSGVGGGGGNLDVHIHNEGEGKFEISEVEEYAISDQRIIDVTIRAAAEYGPYRRSIRQVSR